MQPPLGLNSLQLLNCFIPPLVPPPSSFQSAALHGHGPPTSNRGHPSLLNPSPRYTFPLITHHLTYSAPVIFTTNCPSPWRREVSLRGQGSLLCSGEQSPKHRRTGPAAASLRDGTPWGWFQVLPPPLLCSFRILTSLRGLETLSPKSLPSLGHLPVRSPRSRP